MATERDGPVACQNCGCSDTTQTERRYPDSGFVVEINCAGCGFPRGAMS